MPLELLEERVEAWIKQQVGSKNLKLRNQHHRNFRITNNQQLITRAYLV
jgi:hypothetical protein